VVRAGVLYQNRIDEKRSKSEVAEASPLIEIDPGVLTEIDPSQG
jgi:hypothetical protein